MGKRLVGAIFSLFWFILVSALVLAFVRVNGVDTVESAFRYAKAKSDELSACVSESVEEEAVKCSFRLRVGAYNESQADKERFRQATGIDLLKPSENSGGGEPVKGDAKSGNGVVLRGSRFAGESKGTVLGWLGSLRTVRAYDDVKYSRSEWKHWLNVSGSKCWNTREQVLFAQGSDVVLLDAKKARVSDVSKACSIESGMWHDPYSGKVFSKPGLLDVDHTVPLMAAARAGGQAWSVERKAKFANDPDILVVTSAKVNRAKGAKTPSEWMPDVKGARCDYAKVYVGVLFKYGLSVSEADRRVLTDALNGCVR